MASISKENYLKTVYSFNVINGVNPSTAQIAQELDISNAATSEMAKKLSEKGFISYAKYKGLELTDKGEKEALTVIRRHRLWELFLMKVLGLSWSEVHDEAERLEHHTSEFLIDQIDEYLSFPSFDPHGDPIPNKNGELPELPKLITLQEAETGKRYKLARVDDKNNDLIIYITKLGLVLYKEFEVTDKFSFDNSIIIKLEGNNFSISEKLSNNLYVTVLD